LEQAVRERQKQMQKQSPPSDEKQDKSWEQFVRSIFYFLPRRRLSTCCFFFLILPSCSSRLRGSINTKWNLSA
jgi:hypothetical protein